MNIFEPEEADQIDLRACKIKYLEAQNKWFANQFHKFNSLICNYKQIIALQSHKNNQHTTTIIQKVKLLNSSIEEYIKDCAGNAITSQEIIHSELQMNAVIFVKLILAFQERIDQIRKATVYTENYLQKLQERKYTIQTQGQHFGKTDCTSTIKSIQSYDIYPRVYDRYKKKVMDLKIKRDTLEFRLKHLQAQSKKEIESMSSTVESQQIKKQTPSITELDIEIIPPRKKQQMTAFEQTLLIYKKKKYSNAKLNEKIRFLKKSIENKKNVINKVRFINQNQVWNAIELCQNQEGQYFFESNVNSISLINRTNNGSMEFDFDLSKIITSKKIKTFKSYQAQRKQIEPVTENV